MCITNKMQQQQQQQKQQIQNMSAYLLLRQNDADPRTALSVSQAHHLSQNNDNCRNTKNTNNNNNNCIKTNNTHSCQTNNNNYNNKTKHYSAMNLKLSLLFCALLCFIFATQSAEAAPRIRRGLNLIHRFHIRSAPKMPDSTVKEFEEKLKAAENEIKCANFNNNNSFNVLQKLSDKYILKEFSKSLESWTHEYSWHRINLNHKYNERLENFTEFNLTDFNKIESELHMIQEVLEIFSKSFQTLTNNVTDSEDEEIKKFLKLTNDVINFHLADVLRIMKKLGIEKSQAHTEIIDEQSQQVVVMHVTAHLRIMKVILNFYSELLVRIGASDGRPDCSSENDK